MTLGAVFLVLMDLVLRWAMPVVRGRPRGRELLVTH